MRFTIMTMRGLRSTHVTAVVAASWARRGGPTEETLGMTVRAVGAARARYSVMGFVMGQDATRGAPGAGPLTEAAGDVGFSVMGMGHPLVDGVARGSAKDGVMLMGSGIDVRGCTATGNRANGIGGMGSAVRVSNHRADGNARHGIVVDGPQVEDRGGHAARAATVRRESVGLRACCELRRRCFHDRHARGTEGDRDAVGSGTTVGTGRRARIAARRRAR